MMKRFTVLRRTRLATAAALAALALTAGCGGTDDMNHGGTAGTGTPGVSAGAFNEADVTFAQNMIPHHMQAVQLAELASVKAGDAQLTQLAAQIKAAQSPEIQTLTGWLTAWGRPSAPAMGHEGMAMPGMMSDAEKSRLMGAKGVDFDRMFAQMMIAHHRGAIQMAQQVRADGASTEVKTLATAIEASQTAEVAQLEAILDRL